MVTVGNGAKTSFWHDSWLQGSSPMDIAPSLFSLAWRKNKKVSEELLNLNWTRGLWRMETVQHFSEFINLWELVQQVQLSNIEDSIRWKWTESGVFSAKSAYLAQFKDSFSPFNAKYIWCAHAEGKHKFFTWLFIQSKVLTADKLLQRHWPCNPVCLLCDQEPETADHLFMRCPFAKEVWELFRSWTTNRVVPQSKMLPPFKIGGLCC